MSSMVDDFLGNERTVGKLPMHRIVKGKLQRPYDEDWFAVSLDAGVTYYLTSTNPVRTSGFAVAFFDPALNRVVAAAGDDDAELALEFTPQRSGTYYAMAAELAGNFALAEYTLSIAPRSEPDDLRSDIGTTGVLTSDAPARGIFEQPGDVDWFRFRAEAGVHYSFAPHGDASAGAATVYPALLRIRDAAGYVVETPGSGFNPLVSGDYYVAVVSAKAGPYSVTATAIKDDFAEHAGTSGRLAAGGPAQGSIDYGNDHDWFRVELKEGEIYHFRLQSEQNFVFNMILTADTGERLLDDSGFAANGLNRLYRATSTGTAFLDIDRSWTSQPGAAPYTVTLASFVDDIGDDAGGASLLSLGATARGSLQTGIDRDAFRLSLEGGVSYRFDLSSAVGTHRLTLDLAGAAGGAVLASREVGSSGALAFTPADSGDYLVSVGSTGGVAPDLPYTLVAAPTADDWAARGLGAGQLASGARSAGVLESAGDRDWFAMRLEAGATVWIDAKWDSGGDSSGDVLRILDAGGKQLTRHVIPYNDAPPLAFTPATGGIYYLEFASAYGRAGSYTVAATALTPDDAGDAIATAFPLQPGAAFAARQERAWDVDVFRIDVVAGRTYDIELSTAADSVPFYRLLDANGSPLEGVRSDVRNHLAHAVFVPDYTGAVYASVQAAMNPVAYQVRAHVYQDDHPDKISSAVHALDQGGKVRGVLEHAGDSDVFSIQLDAYRTQVVKLASTSTGGMPPRLVHLRDGAPVANIVESMENGERVLNIRTETAGKYFFALNSGEFAPGGYSITAVAFGDDGQGPRLVAQSMPDQASGVSLTERTLHFTFSEPITIDQSAIVLRNSQGAAVSLAFGREYFPKVEGNTLTLKYSTHLMPDTYTLSLPANAIHDAAGNRYTGPEAISFTTILPVETPGAGNGLYLARPGVVIDGGPGTDTFRLNAFSPFIFAQREGSDIVVTHEGVGQRYTLRNIERLLLADQAYAFDVDGTAGQAYRLYQAAFNRTPDDGGLGFWIEQMDRGTSLQEVARGFVGSGEFASLYGAGPSDDVFVQAVYQNVLHRRPDAAGADYWINAMRAGMERHQVLAHFSESAENKEALAEIIGDGFSYQLIWQ